MGTEATQNWFEGYHSLRTVPSRKNGKVSTLKRRLIIAHFVELVKNWSTDRNSEVRYEDEWVENIDCN